MFFSWPLKTKNHYLVVKPLVVSQLCTEVPTETPIESSTEPSSDVITEVVTEAPTEPLNNAFTPALISQWLSTTGTTTGLSTDGTKTLSKNSIEARSEKTTIFPLKTLNDVSYDQTSFSGQNEMNDDMKEDYMEIMEDDDEDYEENVEAWKKHHNSYQNYKDFTDNYRNVSKSEGHYQIIRFDDHEFDVSS